MLLWPLISLFLNYGFFVETARKMDIRQIRKIKSIPDSRSAENFSSKRLRLEVQPAQT